MKNSKLQKSSDLYCLYFEAHNQNMTAEIENKGQNHNSYQIKNCSTLESVIDVGQGINVGPGKFVKKNKPRVLNKRRA